MLKLQEFLREHKKYWFEVLSRKPYCLKIQYDHENGLVLFKYNQIDSDFSYDLVQEARGIILELGTWKVVRKAFNKFFNLGEPFAAQIDWASACGTEKYDGSLISIYYYNGWKIATNGNYDARNALLNNIKYQTFYDLAREAFQKYNLDFEKLNKNYTYTFELCSPFNSIVIQYPEIQLFHIMTVDNRNCQEIETDIGIPKPRVYHFSNQEEYQLLVSKFDRTHEGIVVKDKYNNRVKIKTPLYFEMHRMYNNGTLTLETVVKLIRENDQDEFLVYFPQYKEEFLRVKQQIEKISEIITEVENTTKEWIRACDLDSYTRKEMRGLFAAWVKKQKNPSMLYFKVYDGTNLVSLVNNMSDTALIKTFNIN